MLFDQEPITFLTNSTIIRLLSQHLSTLIDVPQ